MPLSTEEAALYDRQIRLWGLEGQQRLRNAHVALYTRAQSHLVDELAKHLMRALYAFYSLHNVPKDLNPAVAVEWRPLPTEAAEADNDASVVIVLGGDLEFAMTVNDACREKNQKFLSGQVCGMDGWLFCDAGPSHQFQPTGSKEMKQDDWVTMRDAWKVGFVGKSPKWHRRNLSPWLPLWQTRMEFQQKNGRVPSVGDFDAFTAELDGSTKQLGVATDFCPAQSIQRLLGFTDDFVMAPSASIVGGLMAQQVIGMISGQVKPLLNFVTFDGDEMAALAIPLK